MFKKILFAVGTWMSLNLICMFSCSEKFIAEFGAGLNIITLPCALLITFMYYRVSENAEEEIEDLASEMEELKTSTLQHFNLSTFLLRLSACRRLSML